MSEKAPAFNAKARDRAVVRVSVVGIGANALLAGSKAVIGTLSGSIAIVLDAVNNLSDAASSVITIIGTKLARKHPDRQHPFGHGRAEYLSAMVIALLVLYAGVTSLVESIKKIVTPADPDYSTVSLVIVGLAVAVKIALGLYVKKAGTRLRSESLVNSGKDALLDSVISAATLVSAAIYIFTNVSTEAYLAAVISLIIIKSGIDMLRETLSHILGESADADLAKDILRTIESFDEIIGAYDLILNDYGPDRYLGSVHAEVDAALTAAQLDALTRRITAAVYEKHGVIMTAVGFYANDESDEKTAALRGSVYEAVLAVEYVNQVHGFFIDHEADSIRFDAVISLDAPDRDGTLAKVYQAASAVCPEYTLIITPDTDFSNSTEGDEAS